MAAIRIEDEPRNRRLRVAVTASTEAALKAIAGESGVNLPALLAAVALAYEKNTKTLSTALAQILKCAPKRAARKSGKDERYRKMIEGEKPKRRRLTKKIENASIGDVDSGSPMLGTLRGSFISGAPDA